MGGGGGRKRALYWRGVWEPPTGHAYILKILMTAKKCKRKKTLELLPPDQQHFPLDVRTYFSLSLSLSLSLGRGGGAGGAPPEPAPDINIKITNDNIN